MYDVESDSSWRLEHPTMRPDFTAAPITIFDYTALFPTPSDGIALSPDGQDLFYTPLASFDLYSLPVSVAQSGPASGSDLDSHVSHVGRKASQTDGMTFGHDSLYYGGLEDSAIYKWEAAKDMQLQV